MPGFPPGLHPVDPDAEAARLIEERAKAHDAHGKLAEIRAWAANLASQPGSVAKLGDALLAILDRR